MVSEEDINNLPPSLRKIYDACVSAGFDLNVRIPQGGALALAVICGVSIGAVWQKVTMLRQRLGFAVNGNPLKAKKKYARKRSDEQLEAFGRSLECHGYDPASMWSKARYKQVSDTLGLSFNATTELLRALRLKHNIKPRYSGGYHPGRGTDRVKDLIIEWGIDLVQPLSKALERQIATHLGMGVDNARRCIYAERKRLGVPHEQVAERRQDDIVRRRAERELWKAAEAEAMPALRAAERLAQKADWFEDAHLDLLSNEGREGREKELLCRRYGLRGHKPETLQAIADTLGVTREGVRHGEARAFRRIKPRAENREMERQRILALEIAEQQKRERIERHEQVVLEAVATPIQECDFSVRTWNVLNRMGIKTLPDLAKRTANDLMAERGFGVGCLQDVEKRLAEHGLALVPYDGYEPSSVPTPTLHRGTLLITAKAVCVPCKSGWPIVTKPDEDGLFWHYPGGNEEGTEFDGVAVCSASPIWHLLLGTQGGGVNGATEPATVPLAEAAPSGADGLQNVSDASLRTLMSVLSPNCS